MSVDYTAISPAHRPHRGSTGAATSLERAARAVVQFFSGLAADYRMGRSIRELQALSDESLHDIGIHRSEIVSLVREIEFNGMDRRRGQN